MYILNLAALLLQFGVVLIGFPAQISKNYEQDRCGNAAISILILFSAYSFRFPSTLFDGIWYVYLPDLVGIPLLAITCWQLKQPQHRGAQIVHVIYRFAEDCFKRLLAKLKKK